VTYDPHRDDTGIPSLLRRLSELRIDYQDLETRQTSLEEIFVSLVEKRA
jgi:ABC-2 type transport system ATP-binding protein